MANNLKPENNLLTTDIEANIKILEYEGLYGNTSGTGLIEGTSYSGWQDGNVCYWYNVGAYVIFEVDSPCNIWIIASDSTIVNTNNLVLYQYNTETNEYDINVTSLYCNTDINYNTNTWTLWIQSLPTGKYKVIKEDNSYIVHGEWYAECLQKTIQYNFKDGENIILTKTINENEILDDYLFIKPNEVLVGWEEEIVSDTSAKKVINLNPIYLPYECISENNRVELKKEIYNKLKEIVEKYIIESESEG